jgi:hypothetical protein
MIIATIMYYTDVDLLGCNTMWTVRQIPMFLRNIMPPSSRIIIIVVVVWVGGDSLLTYKLHVKFVIHNFKLLHCHHVCNC